MLFTTNTVSNDELNSINQFFDQYDSGIITVDVNEVNQETSASKYLTSLVSNQYAKSVSDIANTVTDNKRTRKRSLQQVMKESFFAGANRFGTNFIA